jgi:hypothetical protein
VAVGSRALKAHTSGARNSALGSEAATAVTTAADITAIGRSALAACTTGSNNTAVGSRSLMANTTGTQNVAVGPSALDANTTGTKNIAIGMNALGANTTGQFNTAIGHEAMDGNTSDTSYSVAVGSGALGGASLSGDTNTCIGHNAGHAISSGHSNVCIGTNAGDAISNGHSNTIIGEGCDVDHFQRVRAVVVGQDAVTVAQNNTFRAIGDTGCFNSANSSSWSTTSDERIKKNIVDHTKGLNIINQVKIRNFEYRTAEEITDSSLAGRNVADIAIPKTGVQTGLIAQEIELVRPEVIVTDDWGIKRVNRDELFWDMMKAIQELSTKVTALEAA